MKTIADLRLHFQDDVFKKKINIKLEKLKV